MPYRALIWSLVTIALALTVVGMWIRAVEPMVANTQTAAQTPGVYPPTTNPNPAQTRPHPSPPVEQQFLVKGTLLLSFLLICALMVVGLFGTFREWIRYRGNAITRKRDRTQYVDAWKIAGERLKEEPPKNPPV